MLIEMLKQSDRFNDLPLESREVFAKMASEFEDNDVALYCNPTELTEKLGLGSRKLWQEFLGFEPVRQYIQKQMADIALIATRKSMQGLVSQGMGGNVQAAKELKEMSGLLNAGDANKTIVLHQISRPKVVRKDAELG